MQAFRALRYHVARRQVPATVVSTIAVLLLGLSRGTPANAQCPPSEPVPGFFEETIGGEVTGSARVEEGGVIEVCSSSRGYGRTTDSLLGLVQDTTGDFELSVDVVSIDGLGQAGLEARVFRGTGSDPAQAVVRISIAEDATGIGFAVFSGVRSEKAAAMDSPGVVPVPAQLPVRIGIERTATHVTTFFVEGQVRVDHLSVALEPGSSLDAGTFRVGMVHGADLTGQPQPKSGVGRFRDPLLQRQRSIRPPRLSNAVDDYQATVDRPAVLTIRGDGLSSTEEVTVAGVVAKILEAAVDHVTVEVPATGHPVRGDIVVRATGGTSEIPNSFFSFGKSFIRCDCNGDGEVDVSDMIRILNHLFLGHPPCECGEAGDCNDDDDADLSDPITGLTFLFIDSRVPPPPPFPEPGTDPSAPMCGLEDQLPTITGVSQSEIAEGDVFSVLGSGFSSSTRVVIPGARLEVLGVAPDEISLQASMIIADGPATVSLIADFGPPVSTLCRPKFCSSTTLGPLTKLDEPVFLAPSGGVPAIGVSTRSDERGPIVLELDRERFDPSLPWEVTAVLESPPIADVSPGGRATSFQVVPEKSFEETIVRLADRLRLELGAGAHLGEALVLPDTELGRVIVKPSEEFPSSAALAGHVSVYAGTVGRCGSDETHPLFNERAHAWCRFEELVEPCEGLPGFEWYIPLSYVKSKSSSLGGLPHPSNRSPHDKEIMYNWEAYCHVRRHRLWNMCALERLVDLGRSDIPDFPVGAWVTKTLWRADEQIPVGVDKSKLYSYVYNGDGKTYYLTAIHHITKDIDRWFWYDAYPPVQLLEGGKGDFVRGIGGCGGTNVDAPDWTTETIWANYFLCTNITPTQPVSTNGVDGVGPTATENSAWCGNFEFATECPDVIDAANLSPPDDCFSGDDTCLNCHDEGGFASVGGSTIGVDFLHSLKSAVPDPYPCDGGDGPVTWTDHIGPIISNNCSCHSNWMAYGTLVNDPSTDVPTMDRIEPFDPANSYVWHKLHNTHIGIGGEGCAMPYDCSATPTPLADWQLDAIQAWILGGAPYD